MYVYSFNIYIWIDIYISVYVYVYRHVFICLFIVWLSFIYIWFGVCNCMQSFELYWCMIYIYCLNMLIHSISYVFDVCVDTYLYIFIGWMFWYIIVYMYLMYVLVHNYILAYVGEYVGLYMNLLSLFMIYKFRNISLYINCIFICLINLCLII